MNVIATVRVQPDFIDVVKMDACNHSTQAHIQFITITGLAFEQVFDTVTNSDAYWKKAYHNVLKVVIKQYLQVLCLFDMKDGNTCSSSPSFIVISYNKFIG